MLKLEKPSELYLESYRSAVQSGFNNMQLGFGDVDEDKIQISSLLDEAPFSFSMPEGTLFQVLEHEILWALEEKEFIGSLAFRYKMDPELERLCGHIGIAIVPAYQNKGYGLRILKMGLGHLKNRGFEHVNYTVSTHNTASVKLVQKAGGVLADSFENPRGFGPTDLYKIAV